LRDQLTPIREKKVLVVKVVDVTDFHGSFLKKVRDIVGGNPILLVVTKVDLLGANVDEEALKDWIAHEAESRKLTLAGVALVSSKKGFWYARRRVANDARKARTRRLRPRGCERG
jgi:nitric-oxide synthase